MKIPATLLMNAIGAAGRAVQSNRDRGTVEAERLRKQKLDDDERTRRHQIEDTDLADRRAASDAARQMALLAFKNQYGDALVGDDEPAFKSAIPDSALGGPSSADASVTPATPKTHSVTLYGQTFTIDPAKLQSSRRRSAYDSAVQDFPDDFKGIRYTPDVDWEKHYNDAVAAEPLIKQFVAKGYTRSEAKQFIANHKSLIDVEKEKAEATRVTKDANKPVGYQPTTRDEAVTFEAEKAGAEAKARAPYQIEVATGSAQGKAGVQPVKAPPPSIQKAVATNRSQSSTIDKAIAAVTARPTAVGLRRSAGDAINQRLDPDGVDARALVANIGSMLVHDRSGAAVTVSEYPRLAPFVPKITDDSQAIIKKLRQLQNVLANETDLMLSPYTKATAAADAPKSVGIASKYGVTPSVP